MINAICYYVRQEANEYIVLMSLVYQTSFQSVGWFRRNQWSYWSYGEYTNIIPIWETEGRYHCTVYGELARTPLWFSSDAMITRKCTKTFDAFYHSFLVVTCSLPEFPSALSSPDTDCIAESQIDYDTTCTFQCDTGYTLVGDASTVCEETGDLSTSVPSCQSKHFYFKFISIYFQMKSP